MSINIPALLLRKSAIKEDPALLYSGRGARKIGVTTKYDGKEHWAEDIEWKSSTSSTAVINIEKTEIAVFNNITTQDRHFHKDATEIYTVIEGEMRIEVSGVLYRLYSGDSVIVMAKSIHEIFRDTEFLTQVITVNTIGIEDKVVV